VAYGLASAYSVRALQVEVGQYARYNVFVCGPKFITRLVVRIALLALKWGTNALNFVPNFKFSRSKVFFGGGPSSPFGCALSRLGQSLARIKL